MSLTGVITVARGPWADDAACRELPKDLFFPEHLRTAAQRVAVATAFAACDRCPVREDCLRYAIENDELDRGIWGGLDAAERRRLVGEHVPQGRPGLMLNLRRLVGRRTPPEYLQTVVPPRTPTPPRIDHGTEAGYQQHVRHGIEPCRDCLHGHAQYLHYTRLSRARSLTS